MSLGRSSNLPEQFLESFLVITSLFSGVAGGEGLHQVPGIKICLFKLKKKKCVLCLAFKKNVIQFALYP